MIAIPGASAVLAALAIAGLPTDCFTFAGFPPPKTGARETWLAEMGRSPGSLVVYEGASRLPASLASMAKVLGDRPAAVCRELLPLLPLELFFPWGADTEASSAGLTLRANRWCPYQQQCCHDSDDSDDCVAATPS